MRKAFNFYRSYYEVAKELPDKYRLPYLMAILEREFNGTEPKLSGMAKLAYLSQKHSIDSQVAGYEVKTGNKLTPTVGGVQGATEGGKVQEKEKGKEKVELTTPLPPKGEHPLVKWLHTSLPTIQKIKQPLTDAEAARLVDEFDKEAIREVFEAMANTANITKKYQSANLTFRNWMKRRQESNPNYGKKKINEHGYSEHEIKMRKEAFGGYLTKEEQERAIRIERGLEKA